jgi:hypothetical protein
MAALLYHAYFCLESPSQPSIFIFNPTYPGVDVLSDDNRPEGPAQAVPLANHPSPQYFAFHQSTRSTPKCGVWPESPVKILSVQVLNIR